MERPETRFAWNGDIALAYQLVGDAGPDLLYLPGWVSNVELNWDHPVMTRFLHGLARGRRLIAMDPRGSGCSDRGTPRDVPQLETMMDDIATVMDAAGSGRVTILATNEMAFVASMFAATYPDRTSGLILYEASANFTWSEETPWEWTPERWAEEEVAYRQLWDNRDLAIEGIARTWSGGIGTTCSRKRPALGSPPGSGIGTRTSAGSCPRSTSRY